MRCIARFDTEEQAQKFCLILQSQDIESQQDGVDVWVKLEDKIPLAKELHRDFLEGKRAPEKIQVAPEKKEIPVLKPVETNSIQIQVAPLTRFFIFICTVIFFTAWYQESKLKEGGVFPVLPKVQERLMYDYPVALDYAKELMDQYDVTKETNLATLPQPGQELVHKIEQNPPWGGIYGILLDWKEREKLLAPKLFSDIRNGEIWRIFTPTILHVEFLHFLFNMLWLWLLGKMIEKNMRLLTYIAFVAITAVITNTLQYFMTGPFFMGFSGVISAMAGYIWVRKKTAPWELYPIDFGTLIFLWVFIFGLLGLQIVAFFLEILHIVSFQLNIGNTAHVSGVVLGMFFGKVFKRKL